MGYGDWQFFITTLYIRGNGKCHCFYCDMRYAIDNVEICAACGTPYCYTCAPRFFKQIEGAADRSWRCECGGATRAISVQELMGLYQNEAENKKKYDAEQALNKLIWSKLDTTVTKPRMSPATEEKLKKMINRYRKRRKTDL